jgi:hypothetical protein
LNSVSFQKLKNISWGKAGRGSNWLRTRRQGRGRRGRKRGAHRSRYD